MARDAQIPTTVIPPNPGVASAWGLLVCDLRFDMVQPLLIPLSELENGDRFAEVQATFKALTTDARQKLEHENVADDDQSIELSFDMRYVGQSFELNVVPDEWPNKCDDVASLATRFHHVHAKAYGHATPSAPVEIVNLRATATGAIPHPELQTIPQADAKAAAAIRQRRDVYFSENGQPVECAVFDRYRLQPGHIVVGPAIVDEIDSTTVIEPGYQVSVDALGNMLISQRPT